MGFQGERTTEGVVLVFGQLYGHLAGNRKPLTHSPHRLIQPQGTANTGGPAGPLFRGGTEMV